MKFPQDVDGDVLRRLLDAGLDFTKEHVIDFNVDFKSWPPPKCAVDLLKSKFPIVELYEPDEDDAGYVLLSVREFITYEFIINTQKTVTELMREYDGVCESWGVFD